MSKSNDFSWELGLVLFLFVSAWLFRQLRFLFHRFGSYKWPSVPATVQKGSLGTVAVGSPGTRRASWDTSILSRAYVTQDSLSFTAIRNLLDN